MPEGFHPSPTYDKSLTKLLPLLALSDFLTLNTFLGEATINLKERINLVHIRVTLEVSHVHV